MPQKEGSLEDDLAPVVQRLDSAIQRLNNWGLISKNTTSFSGSLILGGKMRDPGNEVGKNIQSRHTELCHADRAT